MPSPESFIFAGSHTDAMEKLSSNSSSSGRGSSLSLAFGADKRNSRRCLRFSRRYWATFILVIALGISILCLYLREEQIVRQKDEIVIRLESVAANQIKDSRKLRKVNKAIKKRERAFENLKLKLERYRASDRQTLEDLRRFQRAQFNDIDRLKMADKAIREIATENANKTDSFFANLFDLGTAHEGHKLKLADLDTGLSDAAEFREKVRGVLAEITEELAEKSNDVDSKIEDVQRKLGQQEDTLEEMQDKYESGLSYLETTLAEEISHNLTKMVWRELRRNLTDELLDRHHDLSRELNDFLSNFTVAANETQLKKFDAMNASISAFGEVIANQSQSFFEALGDNLESLNSSWHGSWGDLFSSRIDDLEDAVGNITSSIADGGGGAGENVEAAPTPPENFIRIGKYFYKFSTGVQMGFHEATSFCQSLGAHLPVFESKEEYTKVRSHAAGVFGKESWWLGASDVTEGHFKWAHNGKDLGFTDWNEGEPNNWQHVAADEDCVEVTEEGSTGTWNDNLCSQSKRFVCQFP